MNTYIDLIDIAYFKYENFKIADNILIVKVTTTYKC